MLRPEHILNRILAELSVTVGSQAVVASEGATVEFTCSIDDDINTCIITTPGSTSLDARAPGAAYAGGRIQVLEKGPNACGLKITGVEQEDFGAWRFRYKYEKVFKSDVCVGAPLRLWKMVLGNMGLTPSLSSEVSYWEHFESSNTMTWCSQVHVGTRQRRVFSTPCSVKTTSSPHWLPLPPSVLTFAWSWMSASRDKLGEIIIISDWYMYFFFK